MYSVFVFHHEQACLFGVYLYVYGATSDHTKELVMISQIYNL